MKIEQGHRSRVDDAAAKSVRAYRKHEELEHVVTGSTIPDSRDIKTLRIMVGEGLKDDAATARSRALQEAVCQGVRQAQRLCQQQQQPQHAHPQQTSVVHWERFLPKRQLQVLLAEDDDSTRHVVSALLRNCSYEVTSATNGLLAWELLMDQTTHVDLVLTEVVMPGLSGIGLLGRIMSHEAFKHIPVIMMSSHDSMNVVFKCLSKGAVDFLVKPVRKNELKNLWQHVWRRCHSSSGSRSGSGSQTLKKERPNGVVDLNESGSNGESEKTSSEFNVRGGSDNGSGTQSRWNRGALEVESCHQSNKPHLTALNAGSGLHPANNPEDLPSLGPEHHGVVPTSDNALSPDFKLAVPKVAAADLSNLASTRDVLGIEPASTGDAEVAGNEDAGSGSSQGNGQRAVDLTGISYSKEQDSNDENHEDSEDEDDLLEKHASNSPSSKDKNLSDSSSPLPESSNQLEFSLKQPCEGENHDREKGSRGGLIHSFASAFSRYNTSSNCTPLIARTNPANTHSGHGGCGSHMPAQESGNGRSHASSIGFMSQIEKIVHLNGGIDEGPARPFPGNSNHLDSLPQTSPSAKQGKHDAPSLPPVPGSFPPTKNPMLSGATHATHWEASAQVGESGEANDGCVSYKQEGYMYSHTSNYSQYHHHAHHHHHHHHIQHHYHHVTEEKLVGRPKTPQANDQTVSDVGTGAPRCGSSNMFIGAEGNIVASGSSNGYGSNGNGAVSVNGSATGSNIGSNGVQSAAVALPGGVTMEVNAQVEADIGLLDTNGALSAHDESRFARREAALNKFRQKRKERCVEKKVRYQSRKRLAEQRPRVRGQFVKQCLYESITIGEPES